MHKHKWKIVNQDTHPSAMEQLTKDGRSLTNIKVRGIDLFTRDVIVTSECEGCGKQKVERI